MRELPSCLPRVSPPKDEQEEHDDTDEDKKRLRRKEPGPRQTVFACRQETTKPMHLRAFEVGRARAGTPCKETPVMSGVRDGRPSSGGAFASFSRGKGSHVLHTDL